MVDRGYIRLLGLDSAPSFRLYLSLCWLWDTHGTFKGRLIGPTVPEVHRDDDGYVVDARGRVATERGGRPSRRATHRHAVRTGGRIINPAALEHYPALSPNDLSCELRSSMRSISSIGLATCAASSSGTLCIARNSSLGRRSLAFSKSMPCISSCTVS